MKLANAGCMEIPFYELKWNGKNCHFGVLSMFIDTRMRATIVFEQENGVDQLWKTWKIETHNFQSDDAPFDPRNDEGIGVS